MKTYFHMVQDMNFRLSNFYLARNVNEILFGTKCQREKIKEFIKPVMEEYRICGGNTDGIMVQYEYKDKNM